MSREIVIPKGKLKASRDDKSAAAKRKELREALLKGQTVITKAGTIKDKDTVSEKDKVITVPKGKLASFYWYENDPELLEAEKEAMHKFFPQFQLQKLDDGRLFWVGELRNITGENSRWYLQVIYEHNHPNNDSFGGSIKIYSIEPDLNQIKETLGESIPHILTDSEDNIYICTARPEDFKAGKTITTAASALAWAAKWIAAFELWLAGDLSKDEFSNHLI